MCRPTLLQPALQTASRSGADIVVQSTHKSLAGLTQAAMLHAAGPLVSTPRIAAALRLLQVRAAPAVKYAKPGKERLDLECTPWSWPGSASPLRCTARRDNFCACFRL